MCIFISYMIIYGKKTKHKDQNFSMSTTHIESRPSCKILHASHANSRSRARGDPAPPQRLPDVKRFHEAIASYAGAPIAATLAAGETLCVT